MKIVFLSNYFNHHQKPLSDALARSADEYLFVAASEMSASRKRLGYSEPEGDYVIHVKSEADKRFVLDKVDTADIVIIGSAPQYYIRRRLKKHKLTFRYSERPLKDDRESWKYPLRLIKWRADNPVNSPIYLLSASAYAPEDYARFGLFRNKAFRWGYFPQTVYYDDINAMIDKKIPGTLLWTGRFLHWKHPETAVETARLLKERGYRFDLVMIGDGEERSRIDGLVREYRLSEMVHMTGAVPYDKVREYMERSEIFLLTSDKQEGWGAVLNEAMNSGCAAVASKEIGSVPYLINGANGLTFASGDTEELCDKIAYLLDNQHERRMIGVRAYETITGEWNADTAAKRFIELSSRLIAGERADDLFKDGPCSKALFMHE